MSGYFAFVRDLQTGGGSNIKDFAQISSAEAHAKRLDATSQARQVKGSSHEDNHFWSLCGEGLKGGGADYVAAFKELQELGIELEIRYLPSSNPDPIQLVIGDVLK